MNKRIMLTAARTTEIVEEPIPEPPAGGMIVKTHYAGVCHSDVHIWEDELRIDDNTVMPFTALPSVNHPMVLGHELCGEVYSFGEGGFADNPDLKKGDKVLVFPWMGCSKCEVCKAGHFNFCPDTTEFNFGVGRDGGFQAYLIINSYDKIHKLPADADMRIACTLTCSSLTTYHAVSTITKQVEDGIKYRGYGRVLVMGAGGLGLWATQWVQAIAPQPCQVYVADIVENKLQDALNLGATGVILLSRDGTAEDMAALAKENAGGHFDAAVDLVGAASTANILHKSLRNGGRQVEIGLAGGTMSIPLATTIFTSKSIQTCLVGNPEQMSKVADLWVEGKVKAPEITVFKPEQAQEVLKMLVDGKLNGRGVLDFTQ